MYKDYYPKNGRKKFLGEMTFELIPEGQLVFNRGDTGRGSPLAF